MLCTIQIFALVRIRFVRFIVIVVGTFTSGQAWNPSGQQHRFNPQKGILFTPPKEKPVSETASLASSPSRTRRQFWKQSVVDVSKVGAIAARTAVLIGSLQVSYAAADIGESIRRSAANIPGLGQPDVYYPPVFQGVWNVTRQVTFPSESSDTVTEASTQTLEYKVRYLRIDDAVIADRGYNQVNLERAIRGNNNVVLQSIVWKETNPNDLRLVMQNGSRKELKVTKRATEKTDSSVFSSEFQRLTTQQDETAIPEITARRVLKKYRVVDANRIEGMELVYSIGGADGQFGDPLLTSLQQSQEPQLLSKSTLLLVRERK